MARYRRYQVKQNKNGSVDVVSYGIFARAAYWWLFAIFAIGFIVAVIHYWYIWVPVIGALTWLGVYGHRLQKAEKANQAENRPTQSVSATRVSSVPAGWYPVNVPVDGVRYWDGEKWLGPPTVPQV
jgi:hypothetical protein